MWSERWVGDIVELRLADFFFWLEEKEEEELSTTLRGDADLDDILALILTTGFYLNETMGDCELTRLVNEFRIRFKANYAQLLDGKSVYGYD